MKRILLATAVLVGAAGIALAQQSAPTFGPGSGPGAMGPQYRAERMLQRFDTNGDGTISQEEIAAYRTTRFTTADTDGDGVLSRDEYLALPRGSGAVQGMPQRDQWRDQMRARHFTALDRDGDGTVSRDEWAAQPMGYGRLAATDTDRDGTLSAEELAQMPYGGPAQGRMGAGPGMGRGGMGPGMGPGMGQGMGPGAGPCWNWTTD